MERYHACKGACLEAYDVCALAAAAAAATASAAATTAAAAECDDTRSTCKAGCSGAVFWR